MRSIISCLSWVTALSLLVTSCYPEEITSTDELTIVVTNHNADYDFASKQTYFLVDSLALYTNIEDPEIDEEEIKALQAIVLDEIEEQMDGRGYTRLNESEAEANPPDLVVVAGAIATLYEGSAWIPGGGWWWWGYPPGWGWGPGWGWYYPPGWGGYPTYYSYTTGTLLIFIADYEGANEEITDAIPLEWNAAIDGLLRDAPPENRIRSLIGQAFDQSPYLGAN